MSGAVARDGTLARLRLMQVADGQFPSGAFAFSQGLETLAETGLVRDEAALARFVTSEIAGRWVGMERVFLARAFAAAPDLDAVAAVDTDCEAHVTVAEAGAASRRTGSALLLTHERIGTPHAAAYRARVAAGDAHGHVAGVQGLIGAALDLTREETEAAALFSAVQSTLTAAVRLGLVGALAAQRLFGDLAPELAERLDAPLPAEPGALVPLADIALAMGGTRSGRLFAS